MQNQKLKKKLAHGLYAGVVVKGLIYILYDVVVTI